MSRGRDDDIRGRSQQGAAGGRDGDAPGTRDLQHRRHHDRRERPLVGAGGSAETWALSGMSLGLATALLTLGAGADALGRRRVLVWSSVLLAAASALGALAPS